MPNAITSQQTEFVAWDKFKQNMLERQIVAQNIEASTWRQYNKELLEDFCNRAAFAQHLNGGSDV